jgi:hypothetical protein
MTSTKDERLNKARKLIRILIGNKFLFNHKRPSTLPEGINYNQAEWNTIDLIYRKIYNINDISIQNLWELEEIITKYTQYLILVKLET